MDDLMSFATDHLLMDPDSGQHSSAANVDQILGQVNKLDTSENSDIVLMEHDSDQNPSAANVDEILVQVNDKQLENAGTPTDVVFFEEKVPSEEKVPTAVSTQQSSDSAVMLSATMKKATQESGEVSAGPSLGLEPLQLGADPTFIKEGFTYVLDAPTSGMVRRGEDALTYLNKDQFYNLTMEYKKRSFSENILEFPAEPVTSIIMLQFRERKDPEEAIAHWAFWHARQHSPHLRLIDVEAKKGHGSLVTNGINEIAHNAVAVKWEPSKGPATVAMGIRCLSTDFSSQKGIKGIPLHIQIDTYANGQEETVCDRGFCQIKIFCDKGAERKAREEEKRIGRHNNDPSLMLMPVQAQSVFQRAYDLVAKPNLFRPELQSCGESKDSLALPPDARLRASFSRGLADCLMEGPSKNKKRPRQQQRKQQSSQFSQPVIPRVLIYARQENEEVYNALHVMPPTVQGVMRAISAKYLIDTVDIRFVFRKTRRGIIVKLDDDMVKYYSNGDVFIMTVLATQDPTTGHTFYDVILSDVSEEEDMKKNICQEEENEEDKMQQKIYNNNNSNNVVVVAATPPPSSVPTIAATSASVC